MKIAKRSYAFTLIRQIHYVVQYLSIYLSIRTKVFDIGEWRCKHFCVLSATSINKTTSDKLLFLSQLFLLENSKLTMLPES